MTATSDIPADLDTTAVDARAPEFPCDSYRDAARHLRRPFTPAAVKFKVQATWPKDNPSGGLIVAYIDARLTAERLNLVVPHLWHDDYLAVGNGQMWCFLTIDGITRKDVGEGQGKALVSDAFKRAGVKFGIGVSLYAIPKMILDTKSGAVKQKKTKDGLTLELTPRGETILRDSYAAWLDQHGRQAFGDPLDHGDVMDAQGDHESGEAPVVPEGVDPETGEVLPVLASAAQKKRLRSDITQNRLTPEVMDTLFTGVQFTRGEGEKVNYAINRLTSAQASALIDTIGQGAVKTGETDVPASGEDFTHPPADDGEPVPFSPEVPA